MTDSVTEYFGKPISTYTAEQAIEDGQLVYPFPDKFPWFLLTAGVHAAIEVVDDDRTYEQRAIPLMMDVAMIVQAKPDDHLWTEGLEGNVTRKTVWIALNEKGGLTLMFPKEY